MTANTSAHIARLQGLYAITDEKLIPEAHFSSIVDQALQGGTRIIQYRDKSNSRQKRLEQAMLLTKLCKQYQALCIINDDVELAAAVNADGVHLGKDDVRLAEARNRLGENAIIGISCYNDISLAINAKKNGADYVAFGAMFSSPTKPEAVNAPLELITQAKQQLDIPVCTIGGINADNASRLVSQGADMIAVISTLFAADSIKKTAQQLASCFTTKVV